MSRGKSYDWASLFALVWMSLSLLIAAVLFIYAVNVAMNPVEPGDMAPGMAEAINLAGRSLALSSIACSVVTALQGVLVYAHFALLVAIERNTRS